MSLQQHLSPSPLTPFGERSLSPAYGVSLLSYLVMAWVLAVLLDLAGIVRVVGGIRLGALCWLGFAATIGLTANMFSEKPLSTYLIDAGYQLVYLMAMGGILAAWR